MEIATLVSNCLTFLTPFLPYLLKAGEHAAQEAGKQLGSDVWEQAKMLWQRLHPRVESRPAALEAFQDMARHPHEADIQAALRVQLRKLLADDPALANDITHLMEGGVVQRVLAERSSTIRDVEQEAAGGTPVQQDITARDDSGIDRVRQRRQ